MPANESVAVGGTKVIQMMERDDTSGKQLAEDISKGLVPSAQLLKAATSALLGLPREVTTVLMAVDVLGFKNTRDMTIMAATRGVYKRFGIIENMLWPHSVSAATGTKRIASQHAHFVRDDAFICGLLHDVGKVILNNECPSELRETFDLLDHPALSFLDIPTEAAAQAGN